MDERNKKGLIQVYTGDGKGKTTAALGLAIRAAGQGMRVGFIQFIKGEPSGEHMFLSKYPAFKITQTGTASGFKESPERLKEDAKQALALAEEFMLSGNYDLLVLDEIFIAIKRDLITKEQVLALMGKKPETLELVLTGRNAPPEILERADLITEMHKVKHPFDRGIAGRRGIEY